MTLKRIISSALGRLVGFVVIVAVPFILAYISTHFFSLPKHAIVGAFIIAAPLVALYALFGLGLVAYLPGRRKSDIVHTAVDASVPVDEQRKDVDWLLGLRGLAAALVFVMHSGIVFDTTSRGAVLHGPGSSSRRPGWEWSSSSPCRAT